MSYVIPVEKYCWTKSDLMNPTSTQHVMEDERQEEFFSLVCL